jgi:hypothetical protein
MPLQSPPDCNSNFYWNLTGYLLVAVFTMPINLSPCPKRLLCYVN